MPALALRKHAWVARQKIPPWLPGMKMGSLQSEQGDQEIRSEARVWLRHTLAGMDPSHLGRVALAHPDPPDLLNSLLNPRIFMRGGGSQTHVSLLHLNPAFSRE
jgi:hypothetical protein